MSGAEDHETSLEYGAKEALQQLLLNWASNVKLPGTRDGAAFVARSNDRELRMPETLALVADLFEGRRDPMYVTAQSVTHYVRHTGADSARALCTRILSVRDTRAAAEALSIEPEKLAAAVSARDLVSALHGKTLSLESAVSSLGLEERDLLRSFGTT